MAQDGFRASITPGRWARLRELLDRVLDHPEERGAILANIRAEDLSLSHDLERVLVEYEESDGGNESETRSNMFPELAGRKIGPYNIDRELGRGGTGTVFLAFRVDQDVNRPVALKLLPSDVYRRAARAGLSTRAPYAGAAGSPRHRALAGLGLRERRLGLSGA